MSFFERERYDDPYTFECDTVGCQNTYVESTWDDLLHNARADGWVFQKTPAGWAHYCPDCVAAGKR